ncbi:MAG: peptidase T [Termitinemataceae bacterium]|nr:MAG: peptidase T [Termitinemataceae bacterium]
MAYLLENDDVLQSDIVQRFLRYVKIWTTSDPHVRETPTSEGQWDLAQILLWELRDIGISDVVITEHCYVIARIPANGERFANESAIGFLAHLDTSADVSGKDVNALYDEQAQIIKTDGKTLLGADDKAGIAEIMAAAAYIMAHPEIEHCCMEIIFTPDEETGAGLPCFPMELISAKSAYTLDGGPLGELESECFNAYSVTVNFGGREIHPGHARGELVNAALMAATFSTMLPRNESPEATDGYYGYYALMEISGNHENASAHLILRDFDNKGMKRRLDTIDALAAAVLSQFPGGTVSIDKKHSYSNMKEKIDQSPDVLEKLKTAARNCGIKYTFKPIRGGTDGSRLTQLGIPTPNIWTGGRNFHSRDEWVSVPDMLAASKVVLELVSL